MKNRAMSSRLGMLCTTLIAGTGVTVAQQNDAKRDVVLDEILVTARRVAESVQDVPVTVNVLSAETLENQAVVNFASIGSLVPNMVWDDAGGGSVNANLRMTLRGISSQGSQNGFEPGIGIYVDDVYVGNAIGFNRSLLDVERIEVLKGPQGTLFGRNTTAGAVALHSRRPSLDANTLEADVNVGNYDLQQERILVNRALGESVAMKFSGIHRQREGYQLNEVSGRRDVNEEDYAGGRVQLLWQALPDLELMLSAEYFKDRGTNEVFGCYGRGAVFDFCLDLHPNINATLDGIVRDNQTRSEREQWATSLHADWRMRNGWDLTSITAYRSISGLNDLDQDGTAIDAVRSGWTVPDDWQVSQEVRIATDRSRRLHGVFGAYYFREERVAQIPYILREAYAEAILGTPIDRDVVQVTAADQSTESHAIFGQGQFELTSHLAFELGLRQTWDNKDFVYTQSVDPLADRAAGGPLGTLGGVPNQNFPTTPGGANSDSDDWSQLTGTASLLWTPAENSLIYLRFARGYKSGGYNSSQYFFGNNQEPLTPFDQETLDQYELGFKWEGFGHRLRLNGAAFFGEYRDIQFQITDPLTNARRVENAAKAEVQGVELEMSALLFDGFTVDANFGRQDSEIVEVGRASLAGLLGKSTYYSPKTTAALSLNYGRPLWADWELTCSVSGNYRADMFIEQDNSLVSPSLTLLNARIGIEGSRWGVHLWGANLNDEQRITARSGGKIAGTSGNTRLNAPRTYGLELSARF